MFAFATIHVKYVKACLASTGEAPDRLASWIKAIVCGLTGQKLGELT
jgi:hypothetical protein